MSDISFAIDIQEKYTRVCTSRNAGGKIELTSLGVKETIPFFFSNESHQTIDNQANIISQLHSSLKIKDRLVNIIIPDSYAYSQIVQMPQLKEKELLSAIRYQSDEFIPMPIEETNLDIQILQEDPKTKKLLVLIAAAPKKMVALIEKTIEHAGLTPGNLENELTAIGRLISEKPTLISKQTASVILNFGYTTSSFYLVDPATSLILFSRSAKIGLDLLLRDIKVNLNLSDKECVEVLQRIGISKDGTYDLEAILTPVVHELSEELKKFVVIAKERYNLSVGQVYLFNYDSHVLHIDKSLSALSALPCVPFPITTVITPNPVFQSFAADISSFVSVISGSL